ncbi:MAG: hypothetical protein HS111_30550 [Kofleriaceae bacterium]|nr:hypothetical protein [Kofleriaceae bacterium]MCL4228328.1 hypothetical protein [Myxococcales bacterium]
MHTVCSRVLVSVVLPVAALVAFAIVGCTSTATPAPTPAAAPAALPPGATDGIDRPGSDYKDFDLASADAFLCLEACVAEAECRAWTYVRPGVQSDKPRCWLKNDVPEQQPNTCCISGERIGDGSTVEE